MIQELYPITGSLRDILLLLECIIAFIFLEFALIFYIRIKNKRRDLRTLQEQSYFWVLLGYSLRWMIIIIADYQIYDSELRTLLINIGYIIIIIFALFFIYIFEKNKIFITKFLFTKIFSIMIIIYICILFFSLEYATLFSDLLWPIFVIFFVFYIKSIYSDLYKKGLIANFKLKFFEFCIGLILIVIGYQLTLTFMLRIFGLTGRLFGDIMQIIGITLIFLFSLSIPSFSEFDWQEKISSILIIHNSGLFIYEKSFDGLNENDSKYIVSGRMTIAKMLFETVTKQKEALIIDQGEKIILIQPGEYIYGAIVCDEKLKSLQILLKKFVEKIESIYYNILKDWTGDINILRPIDEIAKEIFY
ncbi:MAG: hypothetical protein ACFFHV_15575 [Promethearchaeota archaeon]